MAKKPKKTVLPATAGDPTGMSNAGRVSSPASTGGAGPFFEQHVVAYWLAQQQSARMEGPQEFRNLQLITLEELHEIRRIWLYEKHEFDDSLPRIFEAATGGKFPKRGDEGSGLRGDDWEVLREVCGDDPVFFDLQVALLGVERQFRGMSRRAGIYEVLEERLRSGMYGNMQEAVAVLSERLKKREQARPASLLPVELPMVDLSSPDARPEE